MKTILVTGCAGFIGSNFCRLFAKDYKIVGIDNLSRGSHPDNIYNQIQFQNRDIASEEDLNQIFKKFSEIEGIINFAAESHVDHSLADDSKFWITNVLGVKNLAQIAVKNNIRLLQTSTDEVYGHSLNEQVFSEQDMLNPRNPYAASKAAADLLLKSYYASYQLDCVITRGTNTIGPRQSLEKAIPKAISCFLKKKSFPLYKTTAKRMWLSVDDHCSAIMKVFENGSSGELYNISPDFENEIETRIIIEKIRQVIGQGQIQDVQDRAGYDLRYLISSQKIHKELGWKPQKPLSEFLLETIRWYENNQDWLKMHPLWELV